ncbi:MAG: TetR/AcrR family transcriptional regulator [Spirochaetes bacterium]|nr:TetR/AcrR family transcriptional regulator [Spirochaetota bacterium]
MQVKKENKKEKIIKEAVKLFTKYGFEDVSVSSIAGEARIGKGTIYTYFKTKDDILEGCTKYVFNTFTSDIEKAADTNMEIAGFLDTLLDLFFVDMPSRSRILFLFHRKYYGTKRKDAKLTGRYKEMFRKVYERYKEEIKCPFEQMYLFLTGFMMTSYMIQANIDEEILKESVKEALKTLIVKT